MTTLTDKRISKPVFNQDGVSMKLFLDLFGTKPDGSINPVTSMSSFNDLNYININAHAGYSLAIADDTEWRRDKSVMIVSRNILTFIREFKKMYQLIYEGKMYSQTSTGKLILHKDVSESVVFDAGFGGKVRLTPSIVYDDQELTYQAVTLELNKSANLAQLPLDSFERLIYELEKTDFTMYALQLLNFYITLKGSSIETIDAFSGKTLTGGVSVKTRKPNPVFRSTPEVPEEKVISDTPDKSRNPLSSMGGKEI